MCKLACCWGRVHLQRRPQGHNLSGQAVHRTLAALHLSSRARGLAARGVLYKHKEHTSMVGHDYSYLIRCVIQA